MMPERETPGRSASACATPMRTASNQLRASRSRSSFARWSIRYMKPAKTIIATPIIHGLPSVLVMKSSKATPTSAAGMVLTMSSHASLRLGLREAAPGDAAHPGADEPPDLPPEVDDDGDERAQVQGDVERLVQVRVLEQEVPVEQPRDEEEVAGARDGQELGQALDDAQDDRLEDGHGAPSRGTAARRRSRAAFRARYTLADTTGERGGVRAERWERWHAAIR